MKVMNSLLFGGAIVALGLFTSCASTEAEEEAQRREKTLSEDNDTLRRQLGDQRSVESALQREVQTKNAENEQLRRRVDVAEVPAADVPSDAPRSDKPRKSDIDLTGLAAKDIEVIDNKDGTVTLRLAGATFFKAGSADLTDSGQKILERVGGKIAGQRDVSVSVEGHTDGTPLNKTKGVFVNNTNLSLARALAVHDYLMKKNVDKKRMRVAGYGETRPIIAGTSKAANEKNRRVELVLSKAD